MIGGRREILPRLALVVAAALASLLASAAGGAAAPGASGASDVVAARAARSPAAVRDYWTVRRMRAATPAGLVADAAGRLRRAPHERLGPVERRPRTAVDSSATNTAFPTRVHGKVFLTIAAGSDPGDFVCSGTVVVSNGHTLVLTAGHCVDDADFGGGFATNWVFVPGYRDGDRPFGSWPARELFTTEAWSEDASSRQDLGAARVARDEEGRGIEDVVGGREIAFGRPRAAQFVAFGYPAEPTVFHLDFDGGSLFSCPSSVTGSDSPPGSGPQTMQIDCDMSAGSSGGSWVNAEGAVNGLTSYGYATDLTHLYGPYFGSAANELYDRASGPPLLCAGSEVTNLGGAAADDLAGGEGGEAFRLAGAGDVARGLGGGDAACGGAGRDRLRGGPGNDELRGGPGADVLAGGPGFDVCVGGPGRDRGPGCERRRKIP